MSSCIIKSGPLPIYRDEFIKHHELISEFVYRYTSQNARKLNLEALCILVRAVLSITALLDTSSEPKQVVIKLDQHIASYPVTYLKSSLESCGDALLPHEYEGENDHELDSKHVRATATIHTCIEWIYT